MTKQKKITGKAEEVEYISPLETLLSFLYIPHKIYRSIYISIMERRLSTRPLIQNADSIAYLAQDLGIEPALMAEKIKNMMRMKWLELEQVGNRDVNQIFVLSPIWRYKPDIDENKFAIALQQYRGDLVDDKEHQRTTEEIYKLMSSVCPHSEEMVDLELCRLSRFVECETCSHRTNKWDPK